MGEKTKNKYRIETCWGELDVDGMRIRGTFKQPMDLPTALMAALVALDGHENALRCVDEESDESPYQDEHTSAQNANTEAA